MNRIQGGSSSITSNNHVASPIVVPATVHSPPKETVSPIKPASSKEDNIAKLRNMTSDFWSQM